MLALWDKMKDNMDIYYHKYILCDYDAWITEKEQKQQKKKPADLSPADTASYSKARTRA